MLWAIFSELRSNQKGVTAIEYGLIAAMISFACIALLMSIGGSVSVMYNNVATSILGGLAAAAP